jgi:LysM repeat protein
MFRSPARIFAPLSLVACAIAVLVIINHNKADSGGSDSSKPPAATSTVSTTTKQSTKKTPKSYTVKQGDVLSAIAIKTGVSLDTLIRLNPKVDAQTLHAGQKLKLAP